MLLTLAIDSLFSLTEAVAAALEDLLPRISKTMIVFFVCLAGFLGGLVFTTSAGIYFLDITDHFITNYGLVLMGLLQVLAIGWIYGAGNLRRYINEVSAFKIGKVWEITIKYFIPLSLSLFLGRTFLKNLSQGYGGYPGWAVWSFGWGLVAFILTASLSCSYFLSKTNNDE